ncbi:MAG: hypothetical protein AB1726_01385, partial [Planctomycetota bacterium]
AAGVGVAVLAPLLAVELGANPAFFAYGLAAVFPAGLSAWVAEKRGFQSPLALSLAVCALVVAAPSAACAGGARWRESFVLLALLVPFFVWRTLTIRRFVGAQKGLARADLRRIGQREAVFAVGWTFFAVFLIHLLP